MRFALLFLAVFSLSCDQAPEGAPLAGNGQAPAEMPLANANNLPPGQAAEPGESSGIYLGRYKTCKAYAEYMASQLPGPPFGALLNFDPPVECQKAHTCHCLKGVYFIEDFRGAADPLYRCVEPPEAGAEPATAYQKGQEAGLIKFALPRSACDSKG